MAKTPKQNPLSSNTPQPLSDSDRIEQLQLIRSRRVGPATFQRLLGEYGSASGALEALPDIAQQAGVKNYKVFAKDWATKEYLLGQSKGYQLVCAGDAVYPNALRNLGDAPPVFWAVGDLDLLRRNSISIVGARNASSLGARMTRLIVQELGEAGYVVTSGLARGIDAAAHQAALDCGTIAVQASGLDVVYPRENEKLHSEIGERGLRISEQPIGLEPQARHFPQRNRIIAGLSLATVVIEGAARSGSLITAHDAADIGRDVMAVLGNPLDSRAAGCNMLIRDGAVLVRSAKDIIEALAPPQPELPLEPPKDTALKKASSQAVTRKILDLLGPNCVSEDILIRDVGLPAQSVSEHILALELDGTVVRHPGGSIARAN